MAFWPFLFMISARALAVISTKLLASNGGKQRLRIVTYL